jgi:hypothetical protein
VALWVITFIGVLVQMGLCSLDLSPEAAVADVLTHAPAGACWVTGGGRAPVRAPRLCRLLREALRARSILIRHRTEGLASIGVVAGCLPLVACTGPGGARLGATRHNGPRPSSSRGGARLLIRLCISRT